MSSGWKEQYWAVLHSTLPAADAGSGLGEADRLSDWGLDSVSTIALVVELETELEVFFPDELLVPGTFSTAGSLLSVVEDLVQQGHLA